MEKEKVEMLAERPLNYDEFLKHRFRVALSFAGEYRGYVEFVAERLVEKLGRNHVFYDAHFEAFANGTRGDIKLMDLYGRAQLVCVFLGRDYAKKEWAGIVEWDAIRDAQKRNAIDTMYFRFDDEDVPGLLSNVIYTDCRKTAKEKVASLILQRIGEQ